MNRSMAAFVLWALSASTASAQMATFGSRTGGLGNAGGFSTGTGMSNSTQTSAGFGMNVGGAFSGGGFSNGSNPAMGFGGGYSTPSNYGTQSNYGGGVYSNNPVSPTFDSSLPVGNGVAGIDPFTGLGINPLGMNAATGLPYAGGYDLATGAALGYPGLGYAGLGNPGLGYGGLGYPGLGYPGVAVPGLATGIPGLGYGGDAGLFGNGFGLSGMGIPGIGLPGIGLPGIGLPGGGLGVPYLIPGLPGFENSMNFGGGNAVSPTTPPKVQARAGSAPSDDELPGLARSRSNADIASDTTTAIKIQNRLANLKSPSNVKDVRVRMAGRTAVLIGNVNSATDERLIARMVLLEPGVDNVTSELRYPGKPATPREAK